MRPTDKTGAFETFKTEWLLQVAADRRVKAAAPIAIVLSSHLNRSAGAAWPSNATLMRMTGTKSETSVREALKSLEDNGHVAIEWTKGGAKKTNKVFPLVSGKPLRNLRGSTANIPSVFSTKTPQLSDQKPLRKLRGNHLKEPFEGGSALQADPAYHQEIEFINGAPDRAPEERSGADTSFGPEIEEEYDPELPEDWDPGAPPEWDEPPLDDEQADLEPWDEHPQEDASPERQHMQRVERAIRDVSIEPSIRADLRASLMDMPLGTQFSQSLVQATIHKIREHRHARTSA